jgi:hypothetical protein
MFSVSKISTNSISPHFSLHHSLLFNISIQNLPDKPLLFETLHNFIFQSMKKLARATGSQPRWIRVKVGTELLKLRLTSTSDLLDRQSTVHRVFELHATAVHEIEKSQSIDRPRPVGVETPSVPGSSSELSDSTSIGTIPADWSEVNDDDNLDFMWDCNEMLPSGSEWEYASIGQKQNDNRDVAYSRFR